MSVRNSIPFTTPTWRPRAGDWVVVKSAEEIFATLDERGRLDVLPFMPEMLKFCGRRMRVAKVAHKTCDTKCKTGGRWVADCVHLEDSRCDGAAHDGCQAQCNLFWKTAWLRRADAPAHRVERPVPARCNAALLTEATREPGSDGRRFSCQATQITEASTLLPWWDVRQFARDISSGNASVGTVLRVLTLSWFAAWRSYAYPYRLSRWAYAKAHRFLMPGREVPYPPDDIDYPEKGPEGVLDLRVGERVRVKSHREIRATLSRTTGRNRGLWFDIEMVPYCGQVFRVAERVDKIINEETGEMMQMKGPCIILDGVVCRGEYSDCRLLCPRAIPSYWREIWLERVEQPAEPAQERVAGNSKPPS